jgi:hypothetical protein
MLVFGNFFDYVSDSGSLTYSLIDCLFESTFTDNMRVPEAGMGFRFII